MSYLPHLESIKSHIQMAFPNNEVTVRAEDSPFYPHKMLIQTNVDNWGAYIHIDFEHPLCEEHIADILIAGIKSEEERLKKKRKLGLR